ncbi:MAG: guanine deaminase [Acidiferrobacterales bacterium]|nr:guanine deaminase [Acidiferrobacterales bacterium]
MSKVILRTRVVHFISKPGSSRHADLNYFEDAVIVFEDGRVSILEDATKLKDQGFDLSIAEHLPKALLMSGFIDSHVHVPQLDMIGSYGEQLLDWLNNYTFPMEALFASEDYSEAMTQRFINCMLAAGTTTAMAFTTSYQHSTEHLFEQAFKLNIRLIGGQVAMDRNAPEALLDTPESVQLSNSELIKRWHNTGRLGYALTPRFAITSTPAQLQVLEQLQRDYPDVWIQTHLSENKQEVDYVKTLFPSAHDYLDVYESYSLHTNKTVFAHCIHLTDSELQRISDTKSSIAFCPSSNMFLGSGLLDLQRIADSSVNVVLASDVGAGTSLCMFKTMGDAYKACQLQGNPLSASEAFYMSTLGAAKALNLSQHIGNLEVGKEADAILVSPQFDDYFRGRVSHCKTIEEELFVYMVAGDERLIQRTYIAGHVRHDKAVEQITS